MERTNQVAFSVLTSVTVLGIGVTSSALAETITPNPNGAAHQVQADQVSPDAQIQPAPPAIAVPKVVTQGSHGAAHIAKTNLVRKTTAQSAEAFQVFKRGPNGANHLTK